MSEERIFNIDSTGRIGHISGEIVRCCNCIDHDNESNVCRYFSVNAGMEMYGHVHTEQSGFCAWGVKRDE